MTLYKKFSKQFQVNIPQGEMRKHQTKKTKKILITKYSIKSTKIQKNSFLSFLPKLMKNKQLKLLTITNATTPIINNNKNP
jgi:hypothetical protein